MLIHLKASFKKILFLTIIFTITNAWARAGGGGGGGSGGSAGSAIITILFLPFLAIYGFLWIIILSAKQYRVRKNLEKFVLLDSSWQLRDLYARVSATFFAVQNAWMERNQDLAKVYMSDRLYDLHKMQTEMMIKNGVKNVLENINLEDVSIISVQNFQDNQKDYFWVLIKASLLDYIVDLATNRIIKNSRQESDNFKELWGFIKNSSGEWVLDEIKQNASLLNILALKNKNELGEPNGKSIRISQHDNLL